MVTLNLLLGDFERSKLRSYLLPYRFGPFFSQETMVRTLTTGFIGHGHCVSSVVHPSRCLYMYISPSLAISQNLLEFFSRVPHDYLADVQRLKRSYREAKSPDFTLILVPNKHTPFVSDTKWELNFEFYSRETKCVCLFGTKIKA